MFCGFFPTLNRAWSIFFKPSQILNILHALFGPLQGLLDAVAYGMTDSIKAMLMTNPWINWIGFFRSERRSAENQNNISDPLVGSPVELAAFSSPSISRGPSIEKQGRKSDAEIQNMLKIGKLYN